MFVSTVTVTLKQNRGSCVAQLVERLVGNRKVNAISHLEAKHSIPVVVAQHDERHANRIDSVLEWYDRHRASNKEEWQNVFFNKNL